MNSWLFIVLFASLQLRRHKFVVTMGKGIVYPYFGMSSSSSVEWAEFSGCKCSCNRLLCVYGYYATCEDIVSVSHCLVFSLSLEEVSGFLKTSLCL